MTFIDVRIAKDSPRDRGETMLMTTVFVFFLLTGAFALISASEAWGVRRDVQAVAQAAARAAAQVTPEEVRSGGAQIDPGRAHERARAVAAAAGYSLDGVDVSDTSVAVTVSRAVSYAFPAPGFPSQMAATATADARRGVFDGG